MTIRDHRVYTPIASLPNSYVWRGKASYIGVSSTFIIPERRRDEGLYLSGVNTMIDDTADYQDQQAPFFTISPGRSVPSSGEDATVYLVKNQTYNERIWRYRYVPGVGLTYDGGRTGGRIIAPIPDEEADRYPVGAAIYSGSGSMFNLLIPPTDWSTAHLESLGIYRARDALKAIPRGYMTAYTPDTAIVENGTITVIAYAYDEATEGIDGQIGYRTGPGKETIYVDTIGINPTRSSHTDRYGTTLYWYMWTTSLPVGSQLVIATIFYNYGGSTMGTSCVTGIITLPTPVMYASNPGVGSTYRFARAFDGTLDSPHRRSGMGDITGRGFWPYVIWLGDDAVV